MGRARGARWLNSGNTSMTWDCSTVELNVIRIHYLLSMSVVHSGVDFDSHFHLLATHHGNARSFRTRSGTKANNEFAEDQSTFCRSEFEWDAMRWDGDGLVLVAMYCTLYIILFRECVRVSSVVLEMTDDHESEVEKGNGLYITREGRWFCSQVQSAPGLAVSMFLE